MHWKQNEAVVVVVGQNSAVTGHILMECFTVSRILVHVSFCTLHQFFIIFLTASYNKVMLATQDKPSSSQCSVHLQVQLILKNPASVRDTVCEMRCLLWPPNQSFQIMNLQLREKQEYLMFASETVYNTRTVCIL